MNKYTLNLKLFGACGKNNLIVSYWVHVSEYKASLCLKSCSHLALTAPPPFTTDLFEIDNEIDNDNYRFQEL